MTAANPERDEEIWHKYIRGRSQTQLGREYGVTHQAISAAIARHRATIPPVIREEFVQGEIDLGRKLRDEMLALADMNGAPVTTRNGEYVTDPDTGEIVRDYGGRIAAHRAAHLWTERLAKLIGADAPTRIDLSASEQQGADAAADLAARHLHGGAEES